MSQPAPQKRKADAGIVILLALPLLLLGSILLTYHLNRALTLDVGALGDSAFLERGFYSDELDLGYRYRWSGADASIHFPAAGSATPESVSMRVQGARPPGFSTPVTMSLLLNGVPLVPSVVTATGELQTFSFSLPAGRVAGGPDTVGLTASTFRPSGDPRLLGVKLAQIELRQSGDGLNVPPLPLIFWPVITLGGVVGLLSLSRRPMLQIGAAVTCAILIAAGVYANAQYMAAYLPPVGAILALAGLITWKRDLIRAWPLAVDALGRGQLASRVMFGAVLLYTAVALWTIPQVDWIGHADYAENAVVARNFVEGRGLTVDYVAQFYRDYPGITHPAETWPLLQPLLIAPFFMLFGPETWAAKLPNLFLLIGLAWAVFSVTTRLWDARVGLLAGLLTLGHPYFFNTVLYPINDLPFTFLFFLLAWLVWRQVSPWWEGTPLTDDDRARTDPPCAQPPFSTRLLLLTGALAGLLVWSKPSGAVLVLGLALWATWTMFRGYSEIRSRLPWRAVLLAGGAAIVVLMPLLVRNMLVFGKPYFTTESLDVFTLRYWPYVEWENIYAVYAGSSDPPHARWIAGGKFGYENLLNAIGTNLRWVWQKGTQPGQGDFVIGVLPLSVAMLGLATATRRVGNLFGMVFLSLGLYALFVLLYWHFEGRYFQVAVPWLYMLLAWGLFWAWDRLRERLRAGLGRQWGLLFLPVAALAFLFPSFAAVWEQSQGDIAPNGYVAGMKWLAQNSSRDEIVMTRDPWELNWYTRQRAVMIPYGDLATIERIARQYEVTLLQLGGPVDGINWRDCPGVVGSRPAMGALYCGEERPGYGLIYRQGSLTIYRLSGSP